MSAEKFEPLNPLIHSRIRLAILSLLVSVKEADFNYLKKEIDTTERNIFPDNLQSHPASPAFDTKSQRERKNA